jgi:phage terminase large subunit-like protein
MRPEDWDEILSETPVDPVKFINKLTHTKGKWARQSFSLRPWQETVVRQLFTLKDDGLRQYRTALLMLPRKNGKSELAAAIALYGLLADGETGAEVYSAAADRDQASLVFKVAAQMVRNDPYLDAVCDIADTQKRIVHRKSGSEYKAISAEANTKHGFNASMVIYDELHAAPNRDLYDVLTTSMGARENPFVLGISTAGFDRESILWELYSHACQVRDGLVDDPTFLPLIYEAPIDADWTDEDVWRAANPALEDFRSIDEMRIVAARAKQIPAQQNTFRRLYLNQWTEQDERWLDMALWDGCAGSVDLSALQGRECYAGLDLASTRDVTAFVLVFPDGEGGYDVVPHFWVPADSLAERVRRDRVPYDQWRDNDFLHVTDGNVCDYDRVREDIRELAEQFDIREIAYDRWGATHLVTQLQSDGAECVPLGQGFASMSAPTKELDKLILGQQIRHDGNPVLRWMAANVAVEQDPAGNLKPSKKKSTERIDGIVALIMALDRATRAQDTTSAWEDERYEMLTL